MATGAEPVLAAQVGGANPVAGEAWEQSRMLK